MPDRIADPWGERTPYAPGEPWPARVDVHLADGVSRLLEKLEVDTASRSPSWCRPRASELRR